MTHESQMEVERLRRENMALKKKLKRKEDDEFANMMVTAQWGRGTGRRTRLSF